MGSIFLPSNTLPFNPISVRRKVESFRNSKRSGGVRVCASRDDNYHEQVDKNLIVLRKRIHEMKMMEGNNNEPPSNWMEWEKKCYASYDSAICEAMGMLQSQLMDSRPCLVLLMVALIGISVPITMCLILFHFMELTKGVLAGIHPFIT